MRTRWLVVALTVSTVLNGVLLVAWLLALQPPPAAARITVRRPDITNILRPIRTNIVLQPRLLTWADIESEDYAEFVRNLRAIGCPEPTVRDIIVADVDELFATRRIAEVPNPRREWWRPSPDPQLAGAARERRAALEAERQELLTTLLGAGWELDRFTARGDETGNPLDGPAFANLPLEARLRVREIERRLLPPPGEDGGTPDAGAAATLSDHDLREALATVLDPPQVEEYLLRYSRGADRLRSELAGFDPTPDEFRRLYAAREQAAASAATAPPSPPGLQAVEQERDTGELLAEVLGPARYAHYRLTRDPIFQATRQALEQSGLDASHLVPVYQVNLAAREEEQRLLSNPDLSEEDRAEQLHELEQEHLASLRKLLGDEQLRRLRPPAEP